MASRPFLLASFLVALTLAGCSDDGGGEGDDGSATPSPSVSVSASASATTTPAPSSSTSSSSTTAPRAAKTFDIDIRGNDFVDGTLTVQKGDTVRWTQRDVAQHTVTADGGAFDSGTLLLASPPFAFKFDAVGSFPYHCEIHPGMTAAITVVQALPA